MFGNRTKGYGEGRIDRVPGPFAHFRALFAPVPAGVGSMTKTSLLVSAVLMLAAGSAHAQVGALLWEEEFSSLDNWIVLTGNGSWGWGSGS